MTPNIERFFYLPNEAICAIIERHKGERFMWRQGDILFRVVQSKPQKSGLKPLANNIIAYGEVTGHSHAIQVPNISDMESVVDENGDIYVKSDKPINVVHDEHNPIDLPANSWICITRQREYDYLSEEKEKERKVKD